MKCSGIKLNVYGLIVQLCLNGAYCPRTLCSRNAWPFIITSNGRAKVMSDLSVCQIFHWKYRFSECPKNNYSLNKILFDEFKGQVESIACDLYVYLRSNLTKKSCNNIHLRHKCEGETLQSKITTRIWLAELNAFKHRKPPPPHKAEWSGCDDVSGRILCTSVVVAVAVVVVVTAVSTTASLLLCWLHRRRNNSCRVYFRCFSY